MPEEPGKQQRVLVADDDRELCATLEEAFARAGFSVVKAHDGKQCLEAVSASRPDVIVLDVLMPAMNGFEVLRKLRRNPDTELLPVVMLTVRDDYSAELEGLMGGAHRYLPKPCGPRKVVETARELLDAARLDK
jgi:DNA-binding response OmpR family regulator